MCQLNVFKNDGNADMRTVLEDPGNKTKVFPRQPKFLQKDVTPEPPAVTPSQSSRTRERVCHLKQKVACMKDKRVKAKASVGEFAQNQTRQENYSRTKLSVGHENGDGQEGGYSPPPSPGLDDEKPTSAQLSSVPETTGPSSESTSKDEVVKKMKENGIKKIVANSIKRLKALAKKGQSEDDSHTDKTNMKNVTKAKLCPRKFSSKISQKHLREYQAQWIGNASHLHRRKIELAKRKAGLVRKRLDRKSDLAFIIANSCGTLFSLSTSEVLNLDL